MLWALGWSMVLLAFLSRLPRPMLIAMSVAVIALHNLTDAFRGGWLWKLLHQPGPIQIGSYTVIPALHATPSMGSAAGLYPPGYGYGLGSVYVIWLGIIIAMYPLCIWFGRYKRAHAAAWLRYF